MLVCTGNLESTDKVGPIGDRIKRNTRKCVFKTRLHTVDNWKVVVLRKLRRNILNAEKVYDIKDVRTIVLNTY